MMPTPGPPERPDGQDDDAPSLRLALRVMAALLDDLREHDAISDDDLVLRASAVRSVVRRVRELMFPDDAADELGPAS